MNSIPVDLFYEIFSRVPAKSIGRSRCVSKQWMSILCSADFTEYFSANTRPGLLFAIERFNRSEFPFFSSPQIQSKSSSSSAAAYFKLNLDQLVFCGHASGLFIFIRTRTTKEEREDEVQVQHVICNPSLGQHVFLPKLMKVIRSRQSLLCLRRSRQSFLGFDPIDKVFKVLSPEDTYLSSFAYILTLGTGERKWRKVHFPLAHSPESKGICINGSLYYLAREDNATYFMVCFDVRSEKLELVQETFIDSDAGLINYKGKLGVISLSQEEMCIRVLELDDEKQDWSEYKYTLPGDKFRDVECDVLKFYVVGVTSATGEIVFVNNIYRYSEAFYVFYFHLERNVIRRVEVQGFGNHYGVVDAFVDHVEDLTFDMRQLDFLKFESINKFNALCLLEDV